MKHPFRLAAPLAACLACCPAPRPAGAATYYVDAQSGDDSSNGISPFTPWQSLSKLNAAAFSPGDHILLMRGRTWRETLEFSSSGDAKNPIVIDAYGTGDLPVVSGTDLVSGWEQERPGLWKAYVPFRPRIVLFDGVRGEPVKTPGELASPLQWLWSRGILRVYSKSNPDSAYYNPGVEAGSRPNCVLLSSASYVAVQNVRVSGANGLKGGAIYADGARGAAYIAVRGVNVENAAADGMRFDGVDGVAIDSSTVSYAGRYGIALMGGGRPGIHPGVPAVRYNSTHDNGDGGIFSAAAGSLIAYNFVYHHSSGTAIVLEAPGAQVYNNTVFDARAGVSLAADTAGAAIKNNIFASISGRNISVAPGAADVSADFNDYQTDRPDKFDWQGTDPAMTSDFAGWKSKSGQDGHSIIADPNFVGIVFSLTGSALSSTAPASPSAAPAAPTIPSSALRAAAADPAQFKPFSNSPVIHAGTKLSDDLRFGFDVRGAAFPFPLVEQDSAKGWSMGAFVFPMGSAAK